MLNSFQNSLKEFFMSIKFKAVLFDMDGIIIDSEQAVIDCWKITADKYGIPDIEVFCKKVLGVNSENTRKVFNKMYEGRFSYDDFKPEMRELFVTRFDAGQVPVKPGARELLTYLKDNGIKTALCSSTSEEAVKREMKSVGLYDFFDVYVCGDQVTRSKPDPEIWLKGLSKLGVEACDAAGIEDSYNGVRSSHAAGLYTFMVPDLIAPDDEMRSLADEILPSLNDVLARIRE